MREIGPEQAQVLRIRTYSNNELQQKSVELVHPVPNWSIRLVKIPKFFKRIPQ